MGPTIAARLPHPAHAVAAVQLRRGRFIDGVLIAFVRDDGRFKTAATG